LAGEMILYCVQRYIVHSRYILKVPDQSQHTGPSQRIYIYIYICICWRRI